MADSFEASYRFTVSPSADKDSPLPAMGLADAGYFDRTGRWRRGLLGLWMLFVFGAVIVSVWAHFLIGFNSDHLTLMDQTKRMLAGQTPYVDYTDVGPPLIHVMYVLPVTLAKVTGLPLPAALYVVVFAFTALVLLVSDKILSYSGAALAVRKLTGSALALAIVSASFIYGAFADREQIMVMLITPWLVLYSPLARRESVPARWRLTASALAAAGFALKPYFYVFYLATAGFEWWSGRPLRAILRETEHHIVWAFALAYLAVIFIFFRQYLLTIVPVALQTYGVLTWDVESKITVIKNDLFAGFGVAGIGGAIALFFLGLSDRALTYLLLLVLAAAGCFLINSGWNYTQYPFIAMALALAIAAGSKLAAAATRRRRPVLLLGLCALLAAATEHTIAEPAASRGYWDMIFQRERGHTLATLDFAPHALEKLQVPLDAYPRFMFLATNMWAVNLMREGTQRQNVGRFDYLWPLPGILAMEHQFGKGQDYASLASWLAGSVADDLKRHAPDMVIADISPNQRALPKSFDTVGWFKKDTRFADAWRAYAPGETVNECSKDWQENCAYQIYYRK